MRILLWMFMAAVLVLALSPALAGPSFRGYTGLVNIPTADSLDTGQYNLGAFFIQADHAADRTTIVANLGLIAGLEVGAASEQPEGGNSDVVLNAKYQFANEGLIRPAMAVGIHDATDAFDSTPYLVLSKSLTPPVEVFRHEIFNPRVHLGIGGGRLDGLFGGVSVGIGRTATLMLEHDGTDVNAGVRFSIGPDFQLHAGAFDGFDDFGVGVSYSRGL